MVCIQAGCRAKFSPEVEDRRWFLDTEVTFSFIPPLISPLLSVSRADLLCEMNGVRPIADPEVIYFFSRRLCVIDSCRLTMSTWATP